jgi:hypothetical protein
MNHTKTNTILIKQHVLHSHSEKNQGAKIPGFLPHLQQHLDQRRGDEPVPSLQSHTPSSSGHLRRPSLAKRRTMEDYERDR